MRTIAQVLQLRRVDVHLDGLELERRALLLDGLHERQRLHLDDLVVESRDFAVENRARRNFVNDACGRRDERQLGIDRCTRHWSRGVGYAGHSLHLHAILRGERGEVAQEGVLRTGGQGERMREQAAAPMKRTLRAMST